MFARRPSAARVMDSAKLLPSVAERTRMATTIHLPAAVLEAVDRCAAEQGISRSRYIARILEANTGAIVERRMRTFGFEQAFYPLKPDGRAKIDEWFGT